MMVHVYNPNTWGRGLGPRVQSHPQLYNKFKASLGYMKYSISPPLCVQNAISIDIKEMQIESQNLAIFDTHWSEPNKKTKCWQEYELPGTPPITCGTM